MSGQYDVLAHRVTRSKALQQLQRTSSMGVQPLRGPSGAARSRVCETAAGRLTNADSVFESPVAPESRARVSQPRAKSFEVPVLPVLFCVT